MVRTRWLWFVFIIILFGAWQSWQSRTVSVPEGFIAAPKEPIQSNAEQNKVFQQGIFELHVLANFDIEARVLSTESYHFGRDAELAPLDLALGWGAMSNSSVLSAISISQGNRFYYYQWQNNPPIPPDEIASHSANMHLIPANSAVEKKLNTIRVGQVVRITGQLVEARTADGWRWRSSITRDDTGAGACELIRVESIRIL